MLLALELLITEGEKYDIILILMMFRVGEDTLTLKAYSISILPFMVNKIFILLYNYYIVNYHHIRCDLYNEHSLIRSRNYVNKSVI